nr:hypothetical protein TEA_016824 [Ipomoea batatas]
MIKTKTPKDSQGLDPVPVNRCCLSVVLGDDIGLFRNSVLGDEGIEVIVSPKLHFSELDLGPGVHGDGSDKGDVDSEAAVLAGALQAHEDSVGDGGPLRVLLGAVDADLVPWLRLPKPHQNIHQR